MRPGRAVCQRLQQAARGLEICRSVDFPREDVSHPSPTPARVLRAYFARVLREAFGGRLSDEEIGDVAAYVIDQANGDKWDD